MSWKKGGEIQRRKDEKAEKEARVQDNITGTYFDPTYGVEVTVLCRGHALGYHTTVDLEE